MDREQIFPFQFLVIYGYTVCNFSHGPRYKTPPFGRCPLLIDPLRRKQQLNRKDMRIFLQHPDRFSRCPIRFYCLKPCVRTSKFPFCLFYDKVYHVSLTVQRQSGFASNHQNMVHRHPYEQRYRTCSYYIALPLQSNTTRPKRLWRIAKQTFMVSPIRAINRGNNDFNCTRLNHT